MDNLIWKLKNMFRKMVPLALIVGVLYGGYHFYKRGAFRRGIGHGITTILHKVPIIGSQFRSHSSGYFARGSRYHGRRHGRHHGHHRRHRRHR